jgi:hypothetical protein
MILRLYGRNESDSTELRKRSGINNDCFALSVSISSSIPCALVFSFAARMMMAAFFCTRVCVCLVGGGSFELCRAIRSAGRPQYSNCLELEVTSNSNRYWFGIQYRGLRTLIDYTHLDLSISTVRKWTGVLFVAAYLLTKTLSRAAQLSTTHLEYLSPALGPSTKTRQQQILTDGLYFLIASSRWVNTFK